MDSSFWKRFRRTRAVAVIAALAAGLLVESAFTQAAPSAPGVVTGIPSVSSSTGADLSGSVDPDGLPTTAYFQYGIPKNAQGPEGSGVTFSQSTPIQQVASDVSSHPVTATVSGLVPNAPYEVRLVATNNDGTTYGAVQKFTTRTDPPPPRPVLGNQVNVTLVAGHVWIKPPPGRSLGRTRRSVADAALAKGQGFVPLTETRQIPTGSEIDALHGTLKIVTATGHIGKSQNATLAGGIFTVSQAHAGISKGLTNLTLQEGADIKKAPSYASCRQTTKAYVATDARLPTKVLQSLRATAHGAFRTIGRFGAATVRGTVWTIADRCDGTLIHAVRDVVLVQDFVRRTTIVLHAGQSYLAGPTSTGSRAAVAPAASPRGVGRLP